MKFKYLTGLLAVAFLTGCGDDLTTNGPVDNSGEKSYVSISIKASPEARADYEEGLAAENAVDNALFFFFDAAGAPFAVNGTYNFKEETSLSDAGQNMDNVEKILNTVVVIEHHQGTLPASMVAVLNMPAPTSPLSLADLQQKLSDGFNGAYFTMSNAVYRNVAGEVQIVEPLNASNVATTPELAEANPVEIYVERVVSKVRVTNDATTFNTGTEITPVGSSESITVYAKIVGWEVNTTRAEAYLLKQIDPTWDTDFNGFAWNHAEWHRSYWAMSAESDLSKSFTWNSLSKVVGDNAYCLENTVTPVANDDDDATLARTDVTKVLVAAQLKDGDSDTANDVVIADWFGNKYLEANLKDAVAATLKQTLIQKTNDGTNDVYTPIAPEQLDYAQGIGAVDSYGVEQDSYKCYFKLAEGVDTNNWYKIDGGEYVAVADPNEVLANVEPAKIWNGLSYYIVNIRHLGLAEKDGNGDYLPGYYGVVRNHIYDINIEGVSGLGTPVYNPDAEIPEPVTPDETEAFIAARINILSWRVVKNSHILQ